MRAWMVGTIFVLALPRGLAAQHVEVHAGIRVSDRIAIAVRYGTPGYQSAWFLPAPVPPRYTYRGARGRGHSKAHRKAMKAYERDVRKFEREHQKAHRFGISHVHVRGGIQYLEYGREAAYHDAYRPHR